MAKLTTPIPQDKIGESFVWRDWFQKLSDKVFGDLATQNANNVIITGGSITGINFGVTSIIANTGIGVSSATGDVIVTNTGVTSLIAGTGIGVSNVTGGVTVTNTGVTSLVSGSNITVSSSTGAVTVSTTGASGTFKSADIPFKTITVSNGIITSIV
jgi:hypothetical protein